LLKALGTPATRPAIQPVGATTPPAPVVPEPVGPPPVKAVAKPGPGPAETAIKPDLLASPEKFAPPENRIKAKTFTATPDKAPEQVTKTDAPPAALPPAPPPPAPPPPAPPVSALPAPVTPAPMIATPMTAAPATPAPTVAVPTKVAPAKSAAVDPAVP